jgi:hypothetical protein
MKKSEYHRAGLSLVKNLPVEKKGVTFYQNEVIDFGLVYMYKFSSLIRVRSNLTIHLIPKKN